MQAVWCHAIWLEPLNRATVSSLLPLPAAAGGAPAVASPAYRDRGPTRIERLFCSLHPGLCPQDICRKYNIPTAQYETFTDPASAKAFITQCGAPIVVKTSGLAAGRPDLCCGAVSFYVN